MNRPDLNYHEIVVKTQTYPEILKAELQDLILETQRYFLQVDKGGNESIKRTKEYWQKKFSELSNTGQPYRAGFASGILRGIEIAEDDKKYDKNINSLETDEEKWEWVLNNKDETTIYCDNDVTFAKIKGEDDLLRFDEYIGNSYGIIDLFKALNIKVEFV